MLYPQREVCYATMEREAANDRYARLHDQRKWHDGTFTRWAEQPSEQHPYRFDMGVTIGVAETDIRPDDEFLTAEAAPFEPQPEVESEQATPAEEATSDGGLTTTE